MNYNKCKIIVYYFQKYLLNINKIKHELDH